MKPWIVDARDIQFDTDVREFTGHLFHKTNAIDRFLSRSNVSELLVAGPKGCGKTLLLKAKRISISGEGMACLPENALVDKPIGTPRIFSRQDIVSIMTNEDYWTSVWLISIIFAVLKFNRSAQSLTLDTEQLIDIRDDENYNSACDIFDLVISMGRKDYYSAYDDLRKYMVPAYRSVHSGVYMFIDNIDEYFEVHLGMSQEKGAISGELEKDFWYYSQIGLASAARQLQGINNHIKICASIRKEVVQLLINSELGLQLHGGMIEIGYSKDDLEDILLMNIRAEDESNLASPHSPDWYAKFVGEDARILSHLSTGEEEPVEDFLIRHSLWRPRDLAVLGRAISSIQKDRRSERNIRESVMRSTSMIARSYIAECKPHLPTFDESLFLPLIYKNVLTIEELKSISSDYDNVYGANHGATGNCHIFCQLYKVGLLGYIRKNSHLEYTQTFLFPGEGPPELENIIPESPIYLIHPVLDTLIASFNAEYLIKMESLNIVGAEKPWRNESDYSFVLKGDIKGFSEIMGDPELSTRFPDAFDSMVSEAAKSLSYGKVDGGDSVVLIDKNPINILNAARTIARHLRNSPFAKELRFGGSNGLVHISEKMKIHGRTIRTAARIEPFGNPGTILVDGDFYNRLVESDVKDRFSPVDSESHPKIPRVGDKFDVGKNRIDLQTHVLLYEYSYSNEV